jgi:hypothetical protein
MTHLRLVPLALLTLAVSAAGAMRPAPSAPTDAPRTPAPADTICRESPRAWHRAAGDTLWLYILADRATQRVDTQAVVIAGDSAVQLRPRPRRLGPTQAGRLRAMRDRCAAQLRDSTGR